MLTNRNNIHCDQYNLNNVKENTPKYNFTIVGVGTIENISMVAFITWWSVTIASVAINSYMIS